jgi:sialate O-acetylesterase
MTRGFFGSVFYLLVMAMLALLPATGVFAGVRLPAVLASGMVLQRDTVVNIWGWANPGERVTVETDWLVEKTETTGGEGGRWIVALPTGPAGGPHTITIRGENEVVLTDILFGEVWVCSGQSNMEFTIDMLGGWKQYKREKRDLKRHDYAAVRLCRIVPAAADQPQDSCQASWVRADLNTVAGFSATAWFFGKQLSDLLNVPVGLINASIGGTPAEAWTERQCLVSDTALRYFLASRGRDFWIYGKASVLYNAMISPLLNYRIRGVIWYQGEANIHQADLYRRLFSAMIAGWRSAWGQGDFPFYYVQIAPFNYQEPFHAAAWLREAQLQTLSVPNTGMAVTMDIGDVNDIHPKNKQDVGLRLALLALAKTYGQENVFYSGPVFTGMNREGRQLRLTFGFAGGGLYSKERPLTGFTVAGADLNFKKAVALIEDSTVVVYSDSVPDPVHTRFAFSDTAHSSLFNQAGLPASSFRTDNQLLFIRDVFLEAVTDSATRQTFVVMHCNDPACRIRYTLDGSDPAETSPLYVAPVPVNRSVAVRAAAFRGNIPSPQVKELRILQHLATGKQVVLKYPYSEKYQGGTNCLLDGIRGSDAFNDGHWQGYAGVPFEGTVDLGAPVKVGKIMIGFLHAQRSWIFLPTRVTISFSEDGNRFTEATVKETTDDQKSEKTVTRDYTFTGPDRPVRFIRITAENMGRCPNWHPGKGKAAWIFTDEIVVE